jgi:hypothetical protein
MRLKRMVNNYHLDRVPELIVEKMCIQCASVQEKKIDFSHANKMLTKDIQYFDRINKINRIYILSHHVNHV